MRRTLHKILQEITIGREPDAEEGYEPILLVKDTYNSPNVIEAVKQHSIISNESDVVALYRRDLSTHPRWHHRKFIMGLYWRGINKRNSLEEMEYDVGFLEEHPEVQQLVGCYVPGSFSDWEDGQDLDEYIRMFLDGHQRAISRSLSSSDDEDVQAAADDDVDSWMEAFVVGGTLSGPLEDWNDNLNEWLQEVYEQERREAPGNAEDTDVAYVCMDPALNFARSDIAFIIVQSPDLEATRKALPGLNIVAWREIPGEGGWGPSYTIDFDTTQAEIPEEDPARKKKSMPQKGQLDMFLQKNYEDELDDYLMSGDASPEDLIYILKNSQDADIIRTAMEYVVYDEDMPANVLSQAFAKLPRIEDGDARDRIRKALKKHPNIDKQLFAVYDMASSLSGITQFLSQPHKK